MQWIRPNDTWRDAFSLRSATGAAINADSLPTATFYHNGTLDNTVTPAVSNAVTGAYTLSATVPSGYSSGDSVRALVSVTVSGITWVFWTDGTTLMQAPTTFAPNAPAGSSGGLPTVNASNQVAGVAANGIVSPQNFNNTGQISAVPATIASGQIASPQAFNNTGQTSAMPATIASGQIASPQVFNNTGQTSNLPASIAVGQIAGPQAFNNTGQTSNLPANVLQIDGQSAIASGSVTFPATIGTSSYSGGAVASVTGNVGGSIGGDVQGKVLGGGTSTITGIGADVSATSGNVTVGGYASGEDPASLLSNSTTFLDAVAAAAVGSGGGPVAINTNTGGADNLRYVTVSGQGIGGANILIYLASDWPANPGNVQAVAVTGSDGRWLGPAFVSHGTYVAVFTKIGLDGPDVSAPFTV
jgi:hypothetical protein